MVIDDIIPPTPNGADAVMNEVDGVVHLVKEVEELANDEIVD